VDSTDLVVLPFEGVYYDAVVVETRKKRLVYERQQPEQLQR
jgi:hypothetical protein